jgi:3-oxoacyl-[acyl-carrier-protein] synthase II
VSASSSPPAEIVRTEFVAHVKLGRKGLLAKERSTRLALCAAQTALLDAGLPNAAAQQPHPEDLGVVVSSNFGNLETVHKVVGEIHTGGVMSTSPLDLPNASSNIISASVAIRFGCQSVNLMLCNGATGGIDALHVAANVLRAGRARRMIVIGVEPDEPAGRRLFQGSGAGRVGDGAAAVLLETERAALERGASAYAVVGRYGYTSGAPIELSVDAALAGHEGPPDVWLTPGRAPATTAEAVSRVLERWGGRLPEQIDLNGPLGEMYGALGVVQAVAASVWLRARPDRLALATSGPAWNDGGASLALHGRSAA